ncbi:extracellular matrix-binding ebh [Babesia caballi]|uniref:Extracellular matrix-binding ebh n=1 Tax=Babesia caballi TaxID=5871 RepID=A0AAV4LZ02_BABCB|nr:extracellular matrix-binding ebh [Babesia caballi]
MGSIQVVMAKKSSKPSPSNAEFTEVISAFSTGNGDIIAKLADGLQQFIGYEGGKLSDQSTPKLTGGGILPANVAKYQVCNAVLNFVIRFLEGLCEIKELEGQNKDGVKTVIGTLRRCVGTGTVPKGFAALVQKIGEKAGEIDKKIKHGGQTGKLNTVFTALKGIIEKRFSSVHQSHKVDDFQNVQGYIDAVKNDLKEDGNGAFANLCSAVSGIFGKVKNENLSDSAVLNTQSLGLSAVNPDSINCDIHTLRTESKFKDYVNAALLAAVQNAAQASVGDLHTKQYTSYYQGAKHSNINETEYAKIFLGCLPLYYQALTYIYWGCHENGGGWRNLTLGGGALRSYFDSQGLLPTFVESSRTGSHIAQSALKGFQELKTATSLNDSKYPYANFTQKLQEKVKQRLESATECPLAALFYGASCYFKSHQITNAKSAFGAPQTIREMLYFLAAMQFSSAYEDINGYIGTLLNPALKVADSGLSSADNTLSAAGIKEYLTTSCSLVPAFLGTLQGGDGPEKSEPWLYELFCNSAFNFKYVSGASLFSRISNYAYALQFQLSFLYIQCRNTYTVGCGWNQCTYGQGINKSLTDTIAPSHICSVGCTTDGQHKQGDHGQGPCQHSGCGQNANASPLQAFLTDKLTGFSRGHPSGHSDHLATCSGHTCHVPMGFESHLRAGNNYQGSHISVTLEAFCGGFNTPLRQLSEKLSCLTRRTPITLGDLFGFIWHLNGQLFKHERPNMAGLAKKLVETLKTHSSPQVPQFMSQMLNKIAESASSLSASSATTPTILSLSLESMAPVIPFLYQLFMTKDPNTLPGALFDLTKHCHKWGQNGQLKHESATSSGSGCSTPNDLQSLYQSLKLKPPAGTDLYDACRNGNCGPYLYPLTHADGVTYAPRNASTYLSWVLYLSDDLQSWFQEMLDEFKNIDCKKSGCKSSCNHASGTHGMTCSCPSVVQCGGVLPLLYRHGFRFFSAFQLKGMQYEGFGSSRTYKQTAASKRKCSAFAKQLHSVINGDPLSSLLTSIDVFLYAIRWEFFSKLSSFWTIYIGLILYTFFFLLDTLHLRSHLKFTSSHTVPPLALLTTGKAPALVKLTYIGQ